MLERLLGSGWGSITIELPVEPFTFGETVEGAISLMAKQDIGPGFLTMALICNERQSRVVPVKRGRGISASNQRSRREIWRNEVDVDEGLVVEEGATITMPWSLDVPENDPSSSGPADIPDWAKGTLAVLDNLTMSDRFLVYRLEARFAHDAGFTIRRNLNIHIL